MKQKLISFLVACSTIVLINGMEREGENSEHRELMQIQSGSDTMQDLPEALTCLQMLKSRTDLSTWSDKELMVAEGVGMGAFWAWGLSGFTCMLSSLLVPGSAFVTLVWTGLGVSLTAPLSCVCVAPCDMEMSRRNREDTRLWLARAQIYERRQRKREIEREVAICVEKKLGGNA
jgi:hypothetical protein